MMHVWIKTLITVMGEMQLNEKRMVQWNLNNALKIRMMIFPFLKVDDSAVVRDDDSAFVKDNYSAILRDDDSTFVRYESTLTNP